MILWRSFRRNLPVTTGLGLQGMAELDHTSFPTGSTPRRVTAGAIAPNQADRLVDLIHWLSTAGRHLRRHLAEVASLFDLTDNELLVVWQCRGTGWVQVELAGSIGVSPAQMSGMVDRLGSRGLVAMHRPTMDRRRQVWRTTTAGKKLLEEITPHLEELASQLYGGFSVENEQATTGLCRRLAEVASGRGTLTKTVPPANEDRQRGSKEAA
jgi:DNA-binding MarR family transcriptional regulator